MANRRKPAFPLTCISTMRERKKKSGKLWTEKKGFDNIRQFTEKNEKCCGSWLEKDKNRNKKTAGRKLDCWRVHVYYGSPQIRLPATAVCVLLWFLSWMIWFVNWNAITSKPTHAGMALISIWSITRSAREFVKLQCTQPNGRQHPSFMQFKWWALNTEKQGML